MQWRPLLCYRLIFIISFGYFITIIISLNKWAIGSHSPSQEKKPRRRKMISNDDDDVVLLPSSSIVMLFPYHLLRCAFQRHNHNRPSYLFFQLLPHNVSQSDWWLPQIFVASGELWSGERAVGVVLMMMGSWIDSVDSHWSLRKSTDDTRQWVAVLARGDWNNHSAQKGNDAITWCERSWLKNV